MKRSNIVLSLAAGAFVLAPSAAASNHYALDDGLPNSGLSYGIPTDYGWMQWFDTVGSVDAISKVSILWQPGSIPAGETVHVCVWDDPTDDGDPTDALLVAQVDGTVGNSPALTFKDYPILNPALVHGRFFVGAYLTTDGSLGAIALLDYGSPYSGRAWFATNAPGYFDPVHMGDNAPNHIEVLGAGIHGVFMLRAEGTGTVPVTYCTAKLNSLGCAPQIGSFGTPSATAGSGFFVTASNELNHRSGLFFYSTHGRASTPFHGGLLCLATPLRRTAMQDSGGSAGVQDCTGVYAFDFAKWIAGGHDPALIAGTTVDGQYYSRDPGFAPPDNVALSNAIEFTLQQ